MEDWSFGFQKQMDLDSETHAKIFNNYENTEKIQETKNWQDHMVIGKKITKITKNMIISNNHMILAVFLFLFGMRKDPSPYALLPFLVKIW